MNTADNAFILLCAALVMFMTPGLALFYAGMARAKNVLGTAMQSFIMLGLISVLWAAVGYTLAFGPDQGGLLGGLDYLCLAGVGLANNGPVDNLPHITFMIYQCMFAVITPALITGAMAERVRFTPLLVFSSLWLFVVYCPLAHWVWGGGWMQKLGVLDFAGGAVVHVSCASAALAAALATGRRQGWGRQAFIPHSLPLTVTGMGILWFGWFGFNAGSALAANDVAAGAFVTTHFAAAAGTLTWLVVEALATGPATVVQHVKAGKLRVLAHWGTGRLAALPDVPSLTELGAKVTFSQWAGLFAPAGTPEPVIAKLREASRKAATDEKVIRTIGAAGTPIQYLDAPEFAKFVAEDAKVMAGVVQRIGKQ